MDQHHKDAHPMNNDELRDVQPHSTPLGSPSYSPPELEDFAEEMEELRTDHDEVESEVNKESLNHRKTQSEAQILLSKDEDNDDECDEEEKVVRYKIKRKYRASSQSEESDANGKNNEKFPPKSHHLPFKRINPLASHPPGPAPPVSSTKHPSTGAMDAYAAGYGRKLHFADADAAMNDAISPSPSSSFAPSANDSGNTEHDPPTSTTSTTTISPSAAAAARQNPRSKRSAIAELTEKLAMLEQQQQQRESDQVSGKGQGWGLKWQETVTQAKYSCEDWRSSSSASPDKDKMPKGAEEKMEWEPYDAAAWERAAETMTEKQKEGQRREGTVTLKAPPSSPVGTEGGRELSTSTRRPRWEYAPDGKNNIPRERGRQQSSGSGDGHPQKREMVRAVRSYKAILRGTFLSYEKDEIMEVLHRDPDGKFFTLRSRIKNDDDDGAAPRVGRAHTENFLIISH